MTTAREMSRCAAPREVVRTLGDWRLLHQQDQSRAYSQLHTVLELAARVKFPRTRDLPEIVQETVLATIKRPLPLHQDLPPDVPLLRWALKVTLQTGLRLRRLATNRSKHERGAAEGRIVAASRIPEIPADIGLAEGPNDLSIRLSTAIDELRPPFQQIALLRRSGATFAAVARFLGDWRGVRQDDAKYLWRRTTRLLRQSMMSPSRGSARVANANCDKKSAWELTPPPILANYVAWSTETQPTPVTARCKPPP